MTHPPAGPSTPTPPPGPKYTQTPARQTPQAAPAVSGGPVFPLPAPLGPPRFDAPSRPGTPGLPPPKPTPQPSPTPLPPPPIRPGLSWLPALALPSLLLLAAIDHAVWLAWL